MNRAPTRSPMAAMRAPLLVFLLSMLVTGGLAAYLASAIGTKDRIVFDNEAAAVIDAVGDRINTTKTLLRATAGLFKASDRVDADEFERYVAELDLPGRYPGILGIGHARRVNAEDLSTTLQALRAEIDPAFNVVPEDPREVYYPIVYLQPLNRRNRAALGFDMHTEPVRREAMRRAADAGAIIASGKVELVQEITAKKQAGFLLYEPLYRTPVVPDSVTQRREQLVGFIYSPLRAGDLLRGVRGSGEKVIDLQVYDGSEAREADLMYSTVDAGSSVDPRLVREQQVTVGGRPWLLRVSTRPAFDALSQVWLRSWVGLLAVLSSLLLAAISAVQAGSRRDAEIAAHAQRQTAAALHREREWLGATLSSIADGVIAVDREQRVILMNPVAERLTGWTEAEADGCPLDQVIAAVGGRADDPPAPMLAANEHAPVVQTGEITLAARDGRRTPVEHSTAAIRDAAGGVNGAVIVLRDITERRRSEHALRSSEERERDRSERLQLLAAATPMLNSAHSLQSLQAAIEDEAKQLLRAPSARLRLAESVRSEDEDLADTAESGGIIDGALSVPLADADGSVLGALDVAARPGEPYADDDRALLQNLAGIAAIAIRNVGLVEELRATDRRKDEFLAVLAHELRNPLAPISSSLELMRLFPNGEHAARARDVAERQTRHMVRLIDDLLDVSRISRGTISLQRQRLRLAEPIRAAVETAEPLMRARHHRLQVDALPDELWVDGDPARLAQVFTNLLNNAANYTEPGGDIRLSVSRGDANVRVSVRDTGIGIDASMLGSVFDMFVQADRSGGAGGLGIGLTLVQQLASMHGGSVEVHSEGLGRGAEFVVCLPTVEPPAEIAPAAMATVPDRHADPAAPRLLLVDDNRDAAESLALMLRLDGYRVDIAHDGESAIDLARCLAPDVVLLDIGLPGIDGYEVAERLRGERNDGVHLIAITGWGQDADRRRAEAAGFDLHLVKPVDYATLSVALQKLRAA